LDKHLADIQNGEAQGERSYQQQDCPPPPCKSGKGEQQCSGSRSGDQGRTLQVDPERPLTLLRRIALSAPLCGGRRRRRTL
jgi:hypothetical protein